MARRAAATGALETVTVAEFERLRTALLRLVEAVEGDRRHGDRQSWAELQASLIDARALAVGKG